MTMLVRHRTYTPPSFTAQFDRSFDRTFEQLSNSFSETRRAVSGPAVDGAWTDDGYVLTVDLPGVPAGAVTVEVTGTTLSLGAKTDVLEWERSARLGGRLDPDKVSARHVDGRLTVRIGAVDEPAARMISIDTTAAEAPADLVIEATSSDPDQSTDTNDTE
jgi:HSP20 family protein